MKKLIVIISLVLFVTFSAHAKPPVIFFGGGGGGGGGGPINPGVNIGDLAYWDGAAWQPAGSAFNLENSNGSLVLSGGSLANPAIDFDNAGTGFKSGGPGLLQVMRLGSNEITLNPFAWGYAQGGGGIMLQTPSSTVPGLSPYWADPDTGMGWASDQIFLIAGGVPILDVTATDVTIGSGAAGVDYTLTFDGEDSNDGTLTWLGGENRFEIDAGSVVLPGGSGAIPGIGIGDADTGFRYVPSNSFYVLLGGLDRWIFSGSAFAASNSGGPEILREVGTDTNPIFITNKTYSDTGIGGDPEEVALISQGKNMINADATTDLVEVNATLDAQSLNISSVITPPALSGHTHNWNPTGLATARIIRVSSTANYELTGINATGLAGRRLTIINEGSFNVKVMSEDLNSTAEYRFIHSGDETMVPYEALELWYDQTLSRWLIIAH